MRAVHAFIQKIYSLQSSMNQVTCDELNQNWLAKFRNNIASIRPDNVNGEIICV